MLSAALDWLDKNHESVVRGLSELVAIPSISTDGEHAAEIERTAKLTCEQMRDAGLTSVEVLRVGNSLPYAYGEWLEAGPSKPTVFLYAHHDVQPVNYVEQWKSDPWKLTRRDGRLYARGSAGRQGRDLRDAGCGGRVPQDLQPTARQHQDGGRGRRRNRLEEPDALLRGLPREDQVGRDRGLRHREHRGRPAVHHLQLARHRAGSRGGAHRQHPRA